MTAPTQVGQLQVRVFPDEQQLAAAAADDAAAAINKAIAARGFANVMLATGNSQLAFLDVLVRRADVDWARVVGFHMDEYVGMPPDHPASFRRYMRERVVARVNLRAFHELAGDAADAEGEAARYSTLLAEHPLDLCCLGIGENGHLAFNDPGVADFDDPRDVKVVELDEICRAQQVGEGHFATMGDVPTDALTVTIPALLRAARVLAIVPEARKAEPVRRALLGPVTPDCPASALRLHAQATLYLDLASSSLLTA
ncbi:MAG: glucosamine-6-phosphate deaminase [Actinobacteria bacterium]|nr:glucosamine-6-phosphate deaminase [Actinomycetota bacterium]